MDNDLHSPTTTPASNPVKPFPSAKSDRPAADGPAKPEGDGLLGRATQGAHDVIDGLSAKVAGVASQAQDKVDRVVQAPGEWSASAREAVRQNPWLALGGAVLVGIALNRLLFSRSDR